MSHPPLRSFGPSGFRKWWVVLIFGILVPSLSRADHPIHISLCELRLNTSSNAFEVSIKIFIDDLELALEPAGHRGLFIGTEKESPAADQAITDYLRKHVWIEVDGRRLTPVFHGKEVTEDFQAVWCYVEYPGVPGGSRICQITNDVLLEIYDDQRNIMDIRMGGGHKAYTILEPGRSSWTYRFVP